MTANQYPPNLPPDRVDNPRYRIIEKGGKFYPQYRHWFWGWRTIWHFQNPDLPEINRIESSCLSFEAAKKVCDNHSSNKMKSKKTPTKITYYNPD